MNQNKEKIQIETVRTDRFSMDYFKFGRGEKPFVIIPGVSVQSVMGSAELIAEAYKLFADDFTVYVFDRRKNLPEPQPVIDVVPVMEEPEVVAYGTERETTEGF